LVLTGTIWYCQYLNTTPRWDYHDTISQITILNIRQFRICYLVGHGIINGSLVCIALRYDRFILVLCLPEAVSEDVSGRNRAAAAILVSIL
jgi:hypothetical protein